MNAKYTRGQKIDNLHGVYVYYNGKTQSVSGRNVSHGYNLGLKYQCVEFVKRYYYQHLKHKMPDSYGHAKDFFNKNIGDGQLNVQRGLIQYTNPSNTKPKQDDILIFKGTFFNKFGHVGIVSNVTSRSVTIIQQNSGQFGHTRETFLLEYSNGKWLIQNKRVLGWLRKKK